MQAIHKINLPTRDLFNQALQSKGGLEDYPEDDIIDIFTVTFPNGYQVDFKLINGNKFHDDDITNPWLDVVLFDDLGFELAFLEPEHESIEGSYTFYVDDKEYTVQVDAEEFVQYT